MNKILLFLLLCLWSQPVLSLPGLPRIFSDHAVHQAERSIPAWGSSDPSEVATVRLAPHTTTTIADESGRWVAGFSPIDSISDPIRLQVSTISDSIQSDDFLVGEVWTPQKDLQTHPGVQPVSEREKSKDLQKPSHAWNGILASLVPFPFRWLIWYNGETNTRVRPPSEYSQTFPLLGKSWTEAWRKPEMHTIFVRIPNCNSSAFDGLDWPRPRERQETVLSRLSSSMVVATDQKDSVDINPRRKTELVRRLVLRALARVYRKEIVHIGPTCRNLSFLGNTESAAFSTPESSTMILRPDPSGFKSAEENRILRPANVTLKETTTFLTAEAISIPIAIGYPWWKNPPATVSSDTRLSAAASNTDKWNFSDPRFHAQPLSKTALLTSFAELAKKTRGRGSTYQWFSNGNPANDYTGGTPSFDEVDSADDGIFRAQHSNGEKNNIPQTSSLTAIEKNATILHDPGNPFISSWSTSVSGKIIATETISGTPKIILSAHPNRWSSLSWTPPAGTADLSMRETIQFQVKNVGNESIHFTAWALSGPGWGGAPSIEQIRSGTITVLPGESQVVVVNLHQRYPGPKLKARCIDASAVTKIELVLQPSIVGRLAVGTLFATGTSNPSAIIEERIRLDTISAGQPAPGKRAIRQLPEYENTRITHVLHLPANWEPDSQYPILVDYPGNVFYYRYCYSTGLARNSNHGPAVAHGNDFIVLQLPFVQKDGVNEQINGFGDPDLTVTYALAAIKDVVERYAGDVERVIFTGFSRGAYAADYIGLRDERISNLWDGFILSQGSPKSVDGWRDSSIGFEERLARLGERPVFLSRATWEGASNTFSADPGLGENIHTDIGFLLPSSASEALQNWLKPLISTEAARDPR